VSALLNRRIGVNAGVTDLRWASNFVMHKRMARRLADGRRFLMGDAAHLSRLITKRNRVGCSKGRSAGLAPLRMRSTRSATRSPHSLPSGP